MPSRARIVIQGDGVAAQCCARLLTRAGFPIDRQGGRSRPRLPAIMVSAATQVLFQDVFEKGGIFEGFYPITQRIVAWGNGGTRVLPHAAMVADEAALLDRLEFDAQPLEPGEPGWTILATRPKSEPSMQAFGERIAFSLPVALAASAEPFTGWVESVENGWLFLVANAPASAWLLGVGDTPEALLDASKLVSDRVLEATGEARHFAAHPRICWPLCGPGWLACGSGALAFDPLCGDGSGYAVREAILAAAVVKASQEGADAGELITHYRSRMLAGFQKHLQMCESFYRTGGATPWWTEQAESARAGVLWCESWMRAHPAFQYMLRGFDLRRLA